MNPFSISFASLTLAIGVAMLSASARAEDQWVVYKGGDGPGKGKHIVLLAGDQEYRSEEGLPMLGQILSARHGFKCTVLFSINPETGEIDPDNETNVPGMHFLESADMMIVLFRFRELPDKDMKYFVDFVNSGKPILGLRTSTHAFNYKRNRESKYAKYSFQNGKWKGGFGQQVLGDTWINHHGHHGRESTAGVINPEHKSHPILRGVKGVWGDTDVYGVRNLPKTATVLMHGQVLAGMKPDSKPVEGKKNDPMMPLFWVRHYKGESGKESRIICTTMGASTDLVAEGSRRALVNSCYWGLGMEDKIPAKSNVEFVKPYKPTRFGFGKYTRGVKPSDHAL